MNFDQCALTRRGALIALSAAGAAALAAMPLAAAKPLPLDEVIRRNTRARGGAAAPDRMHSVAVDVEIVEGGHTLYAANAAGMVRIDVYAGGKFVGAEGVDSTGVWNWGRNGPEPSVATGAANALTNGAENHLFGWHRFERRGHKLALMPVELIGGVRYPVVEVRYSTGHISYFYVDPVSWQAVRRRDERAYHPDNDQTKQRIESRFSDFRSVAGVVDSHRAKDFDLATGLLLSTNRTLRRVINPRLPPDYFDRNRRAPASWA